jgi:hypothetical protein
VTKNPLPLSLLDKDADKAVPRRELKSHRRMPAPLFLVSGEALSVVRFLFKHLLEGKALLVVDKMIL